LEIKKQYAVDNNLAPTKIDEYLCDHPDVDCLDYNKIVEEMRSKENERQQKEKNKKNLDNMLQENKQRNHLGTSVHGYATKEKDNSYSKTYTSGELNKLNNSENTLNLSRQNSSSNDTRKETGQRNEEKQNDFQNREGNNPRSPNPDQFKDSKKELNSQSNGNEKRFDKPQQFQCKNCDFWNNPDRYICPMCMQVC
jgi:hypothetical protein